jgi:hypothetical protein
MIRVHVVAECIALIGLMLLPLWADEKPTEEAKLEKDKAARIPLTLAVKQDDSKPSVGRLQFVVKISNKTEDRIKMTVKDKQPLFLVKIFDEHGELVNKEILIAMPRKPGGKMVEVLWEAKETKSFPVTYNSPKEGADAGQPLPPGKYKVSAAFAISSFVQA